MRDRRLLEYAKTMRREMSEPEARLWSALRGKRFEGIKFRHQKVIGRYIADFSSRSPMLVVEIDGDSHGGRHDYDKRRTELLGELGYRVVRYSNAEVMTNLEGVLTDLAAVLALTPLPTLSPEGERA